MKNTLFVGSWQKVLIKVILLLLALFVAYKLVKGILGIKWKPDKSESEIDDYIQTELNINSNTYTPPVDNSTPTDPETISNSEADLIANNLQNYMAGTGTNESSMFNALQCLNGASLNKVYASFGARSYDDVMMDLYGWFANELSDTIFVSGVWYNDCVPTCTSWWDSCYDLGYMRAIWIKSSIPVSF